MRQLTATLHVSTPLFPGNAAQQPELLATPFKRALRFWWRALNHHLVELDPKNPERDARRNRRRGAARRRGPMRRAGDDAVQTLAGLRIEPEHDRARAAAPFGQVVTLAESFDPTQRQIDDIADRYGGRPAHRPISKRFANCAHKSNANRRRFGQGRAVCRRSRIRHDPGHELPRRYPRLWM